MQENDSIYQSIKLQLNSKFNFNSNFQEYVAHFDGNTMPEPLNILNANAKLLCMEAAHDAKVAYCKGMDRVGFINYK